MSKANFNIIHFHFHRRKTGVTKSIEQLLPFLEAKTSSAVFGFYWADALAFLPQDMLQHPPLV